MMQAGSTLANRISQPGPAVPAAAIASMIQSLAARRSPLASPASRIADGKPYEQPLGICGKHGYDIGEASGSALQIDYDGQNRAARPPPEADAAETPVHNDAPEYGAQDHWVHQNRSVQINLAASKHIKKAGIGEILVTLFHAEKGHLAGPSISLRWLYIER